MPGNGGNTIIATPVHYYAAGEICHAAMVVAIDANFVAVLRRMDFLSAGVPAWDPFDHPNIAQDNDLTATQTWHYPGSCTNITP
jgi:hypothetical protein